MSFRNAMAKIKINLKKFILTNRKELVILLFILLLGAFLRLYKIDGFMTFLGDEGRDVIIVRRLLVNGDFFLIGPGTSLGGMYLGPLYYYLIAPALWLSRLSPVGPSVLVALIGVTTIFLVWLTGRGWFGRHGGLAASLLYAVSPVVIIFSRSSWNPNVMPFFALLCLYAIWKIWSGQPKWLAILGISYAFVLQSHYLGILLLPTLLIFWFLSLKSKKTKEKKLFLRHSIYALVVFALLMSPLLIFDIRHGFMNAKALWLFLSQGRSSTFAGPLAAIGQIPKDFSLVVTRLLGSTNKILGAIITGTTLLIIVFLIANRKKIKPGNRRGFMILALWFIFGLGGLVLFNHEIYDHYFGFLFPAPFLFWGGASEYLIQRFKITGKILVAGATSILALIAIFNSPIRGVPGYQMVRSMTVARKIVTEARGQRFNLAVIAESNYEDGYKYFLEEWGAPVIYMDPLRYQDTITNQLFVVCEKPEEKCDPTHNPKTEVANFGWSKIAQMWPVDGVILYKLVHSK